MGLAPHRALVGLVVLTACGGRPTPSSADHAASRTLELRMAGARIGEMTYTRTQLPDGGARFVSTTRMVLNLDDQEPIESERENLEEYGPDRRLRRTTSIDREKGVEERAEVVVSDDGVIARIEGPAHRDERSFAIPTDFGNSFEAFEVLRADAQAGAGLPLERRWAEVDAEEMQLGHETLRLLERTSLSLPGGEVPVWRIEMIDEKSGMRLRALLDDDNLPLQFEIGVLQAGVRGTLDDTATDRFSSYLEVEGRLASDRPDTLRVELWVDGERADDPPALVDSAYQRVTRRTGGYLLDLSPRRATPGREAPTLPFDPPSDVARYLEPTRESQSDDPAIVELARRIAGDERDSRAVAEAITREVFVNLEKADGVRGAATAVETLEAGRGDCSEHTALTVALHRAAGIPARAAAGIVLVPSGSGVEAAYHAWTEVWLGEWVVMDAAVGDVDVAATYIWFGYSEPGDPGGAAALNQLLGRTRIVLPE